MRKRSWFITGASSGIGRLLTENLLARGERVFATVRHSSALEDLSARYPELLSVAILDVTDTPAVRGVINEAFARLGRIDIIVNNAGYGLFGAAEELTDVQIRHQIDTNLIGSIQIIRAALPALRNQGGGRILQISSEGGQIAYPNFSLYHASKWGIEGFVEATAQEVAPFNIQMTLVEPGPANTGFGANLVSPPPMAVYDNTPAGEVRRAILSGAFAVTGDPLKMVHAIIDSVDLDPAPKRLTLGSTAFASIHAALSERLAALNAQKAIAVSTDLDSHSRQD